MLSSLYFPGKVQDKLKIVIVWPYSLNNSGFSFKRKDWTKVSSFDL